MNIQSLNTSEFEEVLECKDDASGLHALIAVHSTARGPSLGGIRMHHYENKEEALHDALRLAQAMTYKAAAADLDLGGGKSVIIADPKTQKTPALFHAMGRFINHLQGRYISAKDVGINTFDLIEVAKTSPHVTGLPLSMGGSDDPSPWTAIGVFEGMRTCLKRKLNRQIFSSVRVLIQGLGHVGFSLAGLLHKENAKLIVSDVDEEVAKQAQQKFSAERIAPDQIFDVKADIFSPCAMGGVINDQTIDKLSFQIIAGGSNNQLEDEKKHEKILHERGVLFAPDYILNGGGLINIYAKDILKEDDSMPWIRKIPTSLEEAFILSDEKGISPGQAAREITEKRLKKSN